MGALPKGCTVHDVISFPKEAAKWLGLPEAWVKKHHASLPGVIRETERVKLFHPQTYIECRLNKKPI